MAISPATQWLQDNWNPDQLPNNRWVLATANGPVAQNESIDPLIEIARSNYRPDQVAFAYVTFDLWQ